MKKVELLRVGVIHDIEDLAEFEQTLFEGARDW